MFAKEVRVGGWIVKFSAQAFEIVNEQDAVLVVPAGDLAQIAPVGGLALVPRVRDSLECLKDQIVNHNARVFRMVAFEFICPHNGGTVELPPAFDYFPD